MSKYRSNSYLIPELIERRRKFNKCLILYVILAVSLALAVGGLIYWYCIGGRIKIVIEPPVEKQKNAPICSGIPDLRKFDCLPDEPITESRCVSRGCCWYGKSNFISSNETLPPLNIPYCFYPETYSGYLITNVTQDNYRMHAELKRSMPSGFPQDIHNLKLVIYPIDDNMLRIKITDADSSRFEVPIPLYFQTEHLEKPSYDINLEPKTGKLTVTRKSSNTPVFLTKLSHLVYANQFLQLSSDLPSSYFYGIGEHYAPLLRSVNWTRFTLMNSDLEPISNHSLYGSHPFYMVLENDGNAHGVFLLNSNPMDVILQPAPAITFRPIGGILDFFIMLGPSPDKVVQQYTSIIGRTFMPPYWSLGFQLCRYGYNSLNKTRETTLRTIGAGIPLDVQWNDIDYMERYKDFTYDEINFAGLPKFVDDLHRWGMHYVLMTDPGISNSEKPGTYPPYDEGIDDNIFVKNANGSLLVAKVWTDGNTVFPDFSHPAVADYWTRQFERLYEQIKFDGVWIDMNEPSNFVNGAIDGCPDSTLETPPYVPGGVPLTTKTVCMSAKHYYTDHYNEHNLFGYREAVATNEALRRIRKKRPFIISRATFPGQGVYSGHWSGDISSNWEDMRYTIPSLLNFNMYGMSMVGSDICGFNHNTTLELCARWQALGAFYPFSRNHNERVTMEQDPVALGEPVISATRKSLFIRYLLLPYLYTLFYRSHAFGETVSRPLFFEFPNDVNTYKIDEQFLWGSSLMIIPVLYPNTSSVTAYFPNGVWYNNMGQKMIEKGVFKVLSAPIDFIYAIIRGGSILPMHGEALPTTTESRKSGFILTVALDANFTASGELYWDDGDSLETFENGNYNLINFSVEQNILTSRAVHYGYDTKMQLRGIQVAGLDKKVEKVIVNGVECEKVQNSQAFKSENSTDYNIGLFDFEKIDYKATNGTCSFVDTAYLLGIVVDPLSFSLLSLLTVVWV